MPPLPRLSVVTFTNGPARLVAAALRHVRPVAHEIVVAVDERVPVGELGALQAVADRVVRAEFVHPLEANLGWLHRQATGDWVLRLDGDDLVSVDLLRKLSTPGWDEGITHAYLQYRWLHGAPDQVLDQAPWWPDPVLRLIRNDPGLVRFPHGAHEVAEVAGPARLWDVPLYHLDLLLRPEEVRAAKVDEYEDLNPGHRTDRGWAVSSTYYLPERLPHVPRTAPIPAADAAIVSQVLAEASSIAPLPATDAAALGSVATASSRATPGPVPGDVRVRPLVHDPATVVEGRSLVLSAVLTNAGSRPWRPTDEPADVVGGRFFDASGTQVGFEVRAPLPGPVSPGDESVVRLPLPSYLPAGAERVELGLVQDGVGWHDGTASVRLRRTPGRRVLLRTGVSTFRHLGDDLIAREVLGALARHLPDVVPVLLAHPVDGLADRFGCEVVASPVALGRRARDLVSQARLLARGQPVEDPLVAEALEPFRTASALVLAPGGGLASRYATEALEPCTLEVLIAHAMRIPVYLEGASVGPLDSRKDQAAIAELLNDVQRITVRDTGSATVARRIGRGIDPAVVPDPATAAIGHLGHARGAAAAWLASINVPAGRRYAVVSLRGATSDLAHMETVRQALGMLPEHTAWLFVPHLEDDLAILREDEWAGAHLVPVAPLPDQELVALVAGASLAIGTRFHHSVIATAAGVRTVALVRNDYDRLRIKALEGASGLQIVAVDRPDDARSAVAELLAGPDPEPAPRWDAAAFAGALAERLPSPPPLG